MRGHVAADCLGGLFAAQRKWAIEVFHAVAEHGLGMAEEEQLKVRHGASRS